MRLRQNAWYELFVIVKPCCEWFSQRIDFAAILQVTLIGPMLQVVPALSGTKVVPTNESWLVRTRIGLPVEAIVTKPGSPSRLLPVDGAGITRALQMICIGGEFGAWISTPHATLLPSAVQSCTLEVDAAAHAGSTSALAMRISRTRSRDMSGS